MSISKSNAKSLAVAYEAYCSANEKGDEPSKRCWASMLLRYQDKTGVILMPRERLAALSAEYSAAA